MLHQSRQRHSSCQLYGAEATKQGGEKGACRKSDLCTHLVAIVEGIIARCKSYSFAFVCEQAGIASRSSDRIIRIPMVKKPGSRDPVVPPPPVSDSVVLQREIERLQKEVQTFKELAARAQADLQNARVRMGKEAEEMRIFAAELLLRQLLPTVDSLRRACQHLPKEFSSHEWARGVLSIEKELLRQLKGIGLEPVDAVGKPVDSFQHEVLLTAQGEEGKVLEVLEDGYLFRGKVLRPAKVKVGDGSIRSSESPAQTPPLSPQSS